MNRIVFLADSYQKNHQLFYQNLIIKFSKNSHIDFLICNVVDLDENQYNNTTLHIRKREESVASFIKSHKYIFKKSDLIIFEEHFTFHISILLQIIFYGHKSLQVVHSANKFLKRDLKFNIKSVIAYAFFKIIKSRIKGIIVISQTVKEYILNNKLFNDNVFYIPFNATKVGYRLQADSNESVKFTIPGTVNTERRNYKIFLKVFLRILRENSKAKIKLCLLGKVVKIGQEELKYINEIRKINPIAIDMWHSFIDSETYHEELLTSQFLIGNINIDYTENNIKEVYGQSKETGVLFLMMQYKIPTLFPEEYKYSNIYKSTILPYKNTQEDLYNTIFALTTSIDRINIKAFGAKEHDLYVEKEVLRIHKKFLGVKN